MIALTAILLFHSEAASTLSSATNTTWTDRKLIRREPCPIGSYETLRSEPCILCPPGSFQDKRGRALCIKCNSTIFNGFGANAAVDHTYDFENALPLCALREYASSTTISNLTPSSTPSSSTWILQPDTSSGHNESHFPSMSTTPEETTTPSNAPSRSPFPSQRIPTTPSISPSIDLDDMTALGAVCARNTVALHGHCVDCPIGTHWSIVVAYCLTMLAFALLFRLHPSPGLLFCSLDFYQTMGLLSLIRNVTWVRPLNLVLPHLGYWTAMDWLGVFPCLTLSTQGNRLILISLPFLIATVPLDFCQLISSSGLLCKSYHGAQEWIHKFIYQWSILLLLLTLQSVTVTVAEAVSCENVQHGQLFCRDSTNRLDRAVPFVSIIMGIFHVGWLVLIIWRKRHVTDSILQRVFCHWTWPLEYIVRKLVLVGIVVFWDDTDSEESSGSKILHLIVAISIGWGVIHLVLLRPYREQNDDDDDDDDDGSPRGQGRKRRCCRRISGLTLVSISLMVSLAILSLIAALRDRDDSNNNNNLDVVIAGLILASVVMAFMFGPFCLGLFWLPCVKKRPKQSSVLRAVRDDVVLDGGDTTTDVAVVYDAKFESLQQPCRRVIDDELYAACCKLEQGNAV